MNTRNALIILTVLILPAFASAAEQDQSVRIYLPRSKVITAPNISLEDIAIITGMNRILSDKARAVKLGRAPFPGEKITLSRQVILAQLATSGIYSEYVKMTGAEQVQVRRDSSTIASDDFINSAEEFVKAKFANDEVVWKLVRKPEGLNIAGKVKVELFCSELQSQANGQVRVIVDVIDKADGKNLGNRELLFDLKYRTQRVVATADIEQGQVVSAENGRLEATLVDRRPEEISLPFGLKAIKRIQRGAVITNSMVFEPEPAVLVERNRTVRIKVVGPNWRITTIGLALQNGRCGDAIRVRNVDSKRIIIARVDKTGDVVPIMATP